jgi:hypothetical protein
MKEVLDTKVKLIATASKPQVPSTGSGQALRLRLLR